MQGFFLILYLLFYIKFYNDYFYYFLFLAFNKFELNKVELLANLLIEVFFLLLLFKEFLIILIDLECEFFNIFRL